MGPKAKAGKKTNKVCSIFFYTFYTFYICYIFYTYYYHNTKMIKILVKKVDDLQTSSSLVNSIPTSDDSEFDPFQKTLRSKRSAKSKFILQESSNVPETNIQDNPSIPVPSIQSSLNTASTPLNLNRDVINNDDDDDHDDTNSCENENDYDEDADDHENGFFPNKREEKREISMKKKAERALQRAIPKPGSSSKKARVDFPAQLILNLGEGQATVAAQKIVRMVEMISKDLETYRSYKWMPQQR